MPVVLERVVQSFRQAVQFANPVSANILNYEEGKLLSVVTAWSQNNIERKTKMSSDMYHTVDLKTKVVNTVGCSETTGHLVSCYSPSCSLRGLVREVPAAGKTPKKQYIEIWKDNLMFKQFDLQSADIHGDVFTDLDFGSFEWSPNEELILYVAEKKQPKTESFLSKKPQSNSKDDSVTKGNEFLFTQDWGEQQVGKCQSVLVVADLVKDEIRLLEVKEDLNYFYASATWAPGGGVIAVAYVVEPRRLGRVFCTNRPSYIVHISPEGELTKLSCESKSVFGPKLSPDNSKVIWFQRDVSGPHHSCVTLIKYDWVKKEQTTVVDVVLNDTNCTGGQVFYGLYNWAKPYNCWLPDSRVVILSTPQRASIKTYAVDTELCSVTEIAGSAEEEFSQGVLNVWKDYVICWRSSLNLFPGVYMAKIDAKHLESINWIPIIPCKMVKEDRIVNILNLEGEMQDETASSVRNYTAIYYGPKGLALNDKKIPLIVWSHGGPHSNSSNVFNMLAHFFTKLGFGILMVNYRGSIGAGKNSVDYLLGKIGYTDVSDVRLAHKYLLKLYPFIDEKKCFLYGGSHGGFLSLHLAGQYPDDFVSCTALNPVTNLTQFGSSDIPDWAFVESGLSYSPLARLSGEESERLWRASPLYHVDKVKIPVLLLVGSKDLRVPPYHGINYYYALKECGKVKTKLHLYEDNHPLSQSAHETDFILNTANWFLDSINHDFFE